MRNIIKLDYTLETPEERKELVEKIIEEQGSTISPVYLEYLADYLIFAMDKKERKQKKILTDNRMATINKRETSYEGLAAQFENGEDKVHSLIDEHSKSTIFKPKDPITKKDIEEVPFLKETREDIEFWKSLLPRATGRNAYIIKRSIIETQQQQYFLRDCHRQTIQFHNITKSECPKDLPSSYTISPEGRVEPQGYCLANPKLCGAILSNYSRLKQSGYEPSDGDIYYLMIAFDDVAARALNSFPLYEEIVKLKIDGYSNLEIQKALLKKFNTTHSLEYISSLWKNKIPKIIASKAEDDILENHFLNIEKGTYKRCSKCGQVKLAFNKYFSYNKTSKDNFYSICKECRNQKSSI